jgi:hypothetical protein
VRQLTCLKGGLIAAAYNCGASAVSGGMARPTGIEPFHVLTAIYGRSAMLLSLSYKNRAYQNWKNDEPLDGLLRAVLPSHIVTEAKSKNVAGLQFLVEHLEVAFMQAATLHT